MIDLSDIDRRVLGAVGGLALLLVIGLGVALVGGGDTPEEDDTITADEVAFDIERDANGDDTGRVTVQYTAESSEPLILRGPSFEAGVRPSSEKTIDLEQRGYVVVGWGEGDDGLYRVMYKDDYEEKEDPEDRDHEDIVVVRNDEIVQT